MIDSNPIASALNHVRSTLPEGVTLVAVSKTHPPEAIKTAYNLGQRVFGENKVQELTAKAEELPGDIKWHLIGHLQTNKVKYIIDVVSLIHAVDSLRLLAEINKRAQSAGRVVDVLLQLHIAEEESKFGFSEDELNDALSGTEFAAFNNVRVRGLMGMATFTDDHAQIRREFRGLKSVYDRLKARWSERTDIDTLSMGMSGDYLMAIEEGSTMVRIGSTIFGTRNPQ